MLEVSLEIFLGTVQKTLRLQIRGTKGQEVDCSQPGLLARGHKDDGGEFRGVLADGVVDGLDHGYESRGCVRDGESLDMQLQRYRADIRVEAE